MSKGLQTFLKSKALNAWGLFWLISIPMSSIMVFESMATDLSNGAGISHMISFSVRFAVPFIFLVVAASSVQVLFPGPLSTWWLRNRKYLGLCFAVAMAWQGLFIFVLSYFMRDFYYEDVYLLRDELEGSVGYIFLPALVLTSFHFGRKHLSQTQWKLIHKTGIYFLWAYPFSVYWWNFSHYYGNPDPIDYVFYWSGFIAFALRIAAWGKTRARRSAPVLRTLGAAVIGFGLAVAATGQYWQKPVSAILTKPQWSADLELWFPFWPFEPYLSLLIVALGTLLLTQLKLNIPMQSRQV